MSGRAAGRDLLRLMRYRGAWGSKPTILLSVSSRWRELLL